MTVFTILQNFIAIRQKEPCLRRKYVDFQKMLSDPCLNIAELFQLVCQKNKVLHRIKFNQEIFTKFLKTMHQLSISLLCSSDYRKTYSFCEIKHFVRQAKSLLIHFQGLRLKNITCFITSFLVLIVH